MIAVDSWWERGGEGFRQGAGWEWGRGGMVGWGCGIDGEMVRWEWWMERGVLGGVEGVLLGWGEII